MSDLYYLRLDNLNSLATRSHLRLDFDHLIQYYLPYVVEALHVSLLRFVLLESEFSFDLLESTIKSLFVLVHAGLVRLIKL